MYLPVPQPGRSHDGDGREVYCAYHDIPCIVPEGLDSTYTVVSVRKVTNSLVPWKP